MEFHTAKHSFLKKKNPFYRLEQLEGGPTLLSSGRGGRNGCVKSPQPTAEAGRRWHRLPADIWRDQQTINKVRFLIAYRNLVYMDIYQQ